jgi:hypothetical protein
MATIYDVNGQIIEVGKEINIPCVITANALNPDAKGIVDLEVQTDYGSLVSGAKTTLTVKANLTELRD